MTENMVIHERRKVNEEIENSYLMTAAIACNISTYFQTERGVAILDLYERFYHEFYHLVVNTSDLQQMDSCGAVVDKALAWLNKKKVAGLSDAVLENRCREGVSVFLEYKKAIFEQGIVSLPGK